MVIALCGFALTWFVPERPLRETVAARAADVGTEAAEAFAMPRGRDSADELLRGLRLLADRDIQRSYIDAITQRAGLGLSAAEAYLLIRFETDPASDPRHLARAYRLNEGRLLEAEARLREQGLIELETTAGAPRRRLTGAGCSALSRLVQARRERLAELTGQWDPADRSELEPEIARLSRELVPDAPRRES
jgi:hypothetical protein